MATSSMETIMDEIQAEENIGETESTLRIEDMYKELGDYSWFQFVITLILIFPEIPSGMIIISPIFTSTTRLRFTCETFDGHSTEFNLTNSQLCTSNCSRIVPIQEYSKYTSIVEEWNLVCDRAWLSDTLTSIMMFGMMSGSVIGSLLADRFGRKVAFFSTTLIMAVFGTASAVVPNIYLYGICRYGAGFGVGAFYVVYSIYLIEFLTPSWRTICGCVSIWFFGEMVLALVAYLVPHWRLLTLLTSLPAFLIIPAYCILPESPRFLLCHGKTHEAKKVFDQIAQYNARPAISSEKVKFLQQSTLAEVEVDDDPTKSNIGFLAIFSSVKAWLRLSIFIWIWFSCALVYYGVTFNTKNFSGDPYLNVLYLALVDMPSFPSGAVFNNWLGRRKTFFGLLTMGTVFLVSIVVLENTMNLKQMPYLVTILCFLGRFGIGGAWGVAFCFTAESFPTTVRSRCLGFCQLASNLGGVAAPFVAFFGLLFPSLPYLIFCGVAVLAAISSYFLEETNSKPLKDCKQ